MKKRKVAVLLCMAITAGTLMIGCGANTSDTNATQTESQEDSQAQSASENQEDSQAQGKMDNQQREMGKVTAVNGNEITIALVSMGEAPQRTEGEEGERPEKPEGTEGEMPEKPEGTEGEMPEGTEGERPEKPEGTEGERPEGRNGQMSEDMFEETGETKTIVIEDESIIIKNENGEETAGSLADLAEGTMISLSYDENETLTQVMIGFGGRK